MGAWGDDDEPLDPRALLEADNGVAQYERALDYIRSSIRTGARPKLSVALLCELHEIAMRGLIDNAGRMRRRAIVIEGSAHEPPPHEDVPTLAEEMCDFVNSRPADEPVFLAAYVLWRICWVHPFEDGNGRTARVISYLVLSLRLGIELRGATPIPDRIRKAPRAYQRAIESADAAWREGRIDVSKMQGLLEFYLEAQLRDDPIGLPPGA